MYSWRRMALRPLILAVTLSVAAASGALAQDNSTPEPPANQDVADRAIGRIKSPYCPGLMLEVCPSPQAGQLRDSIGARAARGETTDSIVESVLAQVGEEYRAFPRSGTREGRLAWLVPPVALAFGVLIVALVLRHMRQSNPEHLPEVNEEEERRIQEALARLEQAERDAFEVY